MTNVDASAAAPVETEQPASAMSSTESPATDDGSAPAHTGEGEGDRPLHPTKEAYLPVTSENINKDIRVGIITAAKRTPKALVPAFFLTIDFGPVIGERQSSTQIAECYDTPEELVGTKICCVVNVERLRLGRLYSTCLTLGVEADNGGTCLVRPDPRAKVGSRVF